MTIGELSEKQSKRFIQANKLSKISNRIVSLEGLGKFENLDELYIKGNYQIKTLKGVEECKKLNDICIYNSQVEDFSHLKYIGGQLKKLSLSNCSYVDDLSIILELYNLESFIFFDTPLSSKLGISSMNKEEIRIYQRSTKASLILDVI